MRIFRFDTFEFDTQTAELRRQGVKLRLYGQSMEILGMLLERPGEVVRREELRARLGDPDLVILDVRRATDWSTSDVKIQGAVRADPGDVAAWADTYPKEKTLVLYCA